MRLSPCAGRFRASRRLLALYTKCREQFLHVRRKGGLERQTRFRYGVSEPKSRCVKRLAMKVQLIEQLSVNAFSATVDRVTEQSVADRRQMDADLVGPTGFEPAFDQRRTL